MARDYTKYNVEGLGENLNKRQLVFTIVKDWVEKNNMRSSSILKSPRNLKNEKRAVNIFLVFVFLVYTGSLLGQENNLKVEQFDYSNFKNVEKRTGFFSSFPIDNDLKEIEYSPLELSDNFSERVKNLILTTKKQWSSLGIIAKLSKEKLELTNTNSLVIKENPSNKSRYIQENFTNDGRLETISMSTIETVSLILTNENDTLILLPKVRRVFNKGTSAYDNIHLLYYIDLQNLRNIYLKNIESINDVLTLKNHISTLKKFSLELTDSEKEELNINIQTRIIESLDSINLPKFYLASVNRTEPAAQTKSYFYAVEKNPDNRFFGLGEEYDDFPSMDPLIDDLIFIDSIPLKINRNKLKQIIRSTDYVAHFSDRFDSGMRYDGKTQYTRVHGGLTNLDSTETLFMTTSDGGRFSNSKNPLYLEEFPSYTDFIKNFLLNVREKDFPLSDLDAIGFSIDENHIYSKDSIGFVLKIKKGSNSTPRTSRYGGKIYGTNKQAMYDYAKKFHKFYWNWKKEVEEEKRKKELAAEQEKEQQKQELAKKYGRKYVDAMYELKIIVGMPEDLVNVIVNKMYTVGSTSSSSSGDYYRLDPRYGTGWVSVWIKNKKVTSVTYH